MKQRKKKSNALLWVLLAVTVLALILAAVLLLGGDGDSDWQEQYDLGRRYLEDGNYEEAILAFSAAIEIDPKRPEAYMGRGEAYMELGDYAAAMEDFEKAQRRDPDNEEIAEKIEELEQKMEEQEQEQLIMKRLVCVRIVQNNGSLVDEHHMTYNAAGQLTSMKNSSEDASDGRSYGHEYVYTYDEAGHLLREEDITTGSSRVYEYDAQGHLIHEIITEDWGETIHVVEVYYDYDGQGNKIRETMGSGNAWTEYIFEYDDRGNLIKEYDEYGMDVTEYTYDAENRLISSSAKNYGGTTGGEIHTNTTYTYDEDGRLTDKSVVMEGYESVGYRYGYYPWITAESAYRDGAFSNGTLWVEDFITLGFGDTDEFIMEEGYLTMVTGDSYYYEFIYEEIIDTPVEETQPPQPVIRDSAEYELNRVDQSYYDEDGVLRMEKFHDQVVLLGDMPEYAAINADSASWAAGFVADMDEAFVKESLPYMGDDMYYLNTASATVTHNSDGIFSYYLTTAWFAGGVFTVSDYGRTYDLTTGQLLNLPETFGMGEEELVAAMKDNAWAYLSTNCYDAMFDDARDTLYAYELEDFNYYIEDGQLILVFPTYVLSYGAAGPLTAPTGLYIP